jgi:hypothetical protein
MLLRLRFISNHPGRACFNGVQKTPRWSQIECALGHCMGRSIWQHGGTNGAVTVAQVVWTFLFITFGRNVNLEVLFLVDSAFSSGSFIARIIFVFVCCF